MGRKLLRFCREVGPGRKRGKLGQRPASFRGSCPWGHALSTEDQATVTFAHGTLAVQKEPSEPVWKEAVLGWRDWQCRQQQ
jgi:hypothetical protein